MPYKDKNKQREYQKKWIANRRKEFFKDKHCKKCGTNKNLELHHKDHKQKIDHRIFSWSEKRQKLEIKKCEVLCTSCHWNVTFAQLEYGKLKHGTLTAYKGFHKCRCKLCKKANSEYERKRRIKI